MKTRRDLLYYFDIEKDSGVIDFYLFFFPFIQNQWLHGPAFSNGVNLWRDFFFFFKFNFNFAAWAPLFYLVNFAQANLKRKHTQIIYVHKFRLLCVMFCILRAGSVFHMDKGAVFFFISCSHSLEFLSSFFFPSLH